MLPKTFRSTSVREGWNGMAHWMRKQALEEQDHAMKIFDHIVKRDGHVELEALSKPEREWDSPLAAFKGAHAHEQFITGRIHDLVKLAEEEDDKKARTMLQWFVNEQVEEEENTSKVVGMIEDIASSDSSLGTVDKELAKR